mmetsp:Transcript_18767/g.44732  ORF Transcript_18767/g.44732 Transcript_18767/m.44732 type:complete len:462 (-) Transcript_18767:159-1544(-)
MVSGAPPSPGLVLAALNVAPGGGVGCWRRFRGVSSRSRTSSAASTSWQLRSISSTVTGCHPALPAPHAACGSPPTASASSSSVLTCWSSVLNWRPARSSDLTRPMRLARAWRAARAVVARSTSAGLSHGRSCVSEARSCGARESVCITPRVASLCCFACSARSLKGASRASSAADRWLISSSFAACPWSSSHSSKRWSWCIAAMASCGRHSTSPSSSWLASINAFPSYTLASSKLRCSSALRTTRSRASTPSTSSTASFISASSMLRATTPPPYCTDTANSVSTSPAPGRPPHSLKREGAGAAVGRLNVARSIAVSPDRSTRTCRLTTGGSSVPPLSAACCAAAASTPKIEKVEMVAGTSPTSLTTRTTKSRGSGAETERTWRWPPSSPAVTTSGLPRWIAGSMRGPTSSVMSNGAASRTSKRFTFPRASTGLSAKARSAAPETSASSALSVLLVGISDES